MLRYKIIMTSINVVLALLALGFLLLLSTSNAQDSYRRADALLRHGQDLMLMLDNETLSAAQGGVDNRLQLLSLAQQLADVNLKLGADINRIYQPAAFPDVWRPLATRLFNSVGNSDQTHFDGIKIRREHDNLVTVLGGFQADLNRFGERARHYVDTRNYVRSESRSIVQTLRARGRTSDADLIFRGTQQIIERTASAASGQLSQVDELVERIQNGLANVEVEGRSPEDLIAYVRELKIARQQVLNTRQQLNLPTLSGRWNELRDALLQDYLFSLATINDARVLLNIYTVLLLIILVYFGLRLTRSHRALNSAYDDLEARVQERTKDLERAYDDLQESQVQLVQAEKMSSLGQLVAGVMHEINTPLLYVQNNTTVTAETVTELKDYVEATQALINTEVSAQQLEPQLRALRANIDVENVLQGSEEVATLAEDSIEGLQQISELVQSLKDFSRLDRAAKDRFNVREGLEKTLTITRNVLKHGVEVVRNFADVPDIYCSPSRINQIFINLVTNAVQAMNGAGRLTLSVRSDGDEVLITVADTGCGIPQENLDRIMDPFFTTKPVGQGTGLGLSIVRSIVQEHAGRIEIESKEGEGTAITLILPVRRPLDMDKDVVEEVAA